MKAEMLLAGDKSAGTDRAINNMIRVLRFYQHMFVIWQIQPPSLGPGIPLFEIMRISMTTPDVLFQIDYPWGFLCPEGHVLINIESERVHDKQRRG